MIRDLHLCFSVNISVFKIFVNIIRAIQVYECACSLTGELDKLVEKKSEHPYNKFIQPSVTIGQAGR